MKAKGSTINARVAEPMREALEAVVRERRMKTGDDVRLADIVREALSSYLDDPANTRTTRDVGAEAFGTHVLNALEGLEEEARHLGLEDSQDFGMAIWKTATDDPRLDDLLCFSNRLNEALKAT